MRSGADTPSRYRQVQWRRLDQCAAERATLAVGIDGWLLAGEVRGVLPDDRKYVVRYSVSCAPDWTTRSAVIDGHIGDALIQARVAQGVLGEWTVNEDPAPHLRACTDIDLGFSPITNTIPIRRLSLDVGGQARVTAAWLSFPAFDVQPLDQVYERLTTHTYRYQSAGGRFTADLDVDEDGLVTRYGAIWASAAQGKAG